MARRAKKNKPNRAEQFYIRMEQLIGSDEARRLMEAVDQTGPRSVRYNRGLVSPGHLTGGVVPWCQPFGRYWEKDILPARTVEYAAGRYYVQEASAMLAVSAASRVMDFSGKAVLDLTAAPGGKATQAAELMDSGFLVANEVIKKRVDALTWNINRHRLNNVMVTNLPTGKLAENLGGFFDIVIVDAPCSGEGLFRKQKHSLENWSEKNVRFCAARQTSILRDALALARPGGFIVYSTCTFAGEENEQQVEFLLREGMEPVPLPEDLPVSPAISGNPEVSVCSRRVFPHREGGAGAFVAVVRKKNGDEPGFTGKYTGENAGEFRQRYRDFPHLDLQSVKGYFYEKNGITGLFSHHRIPEFLFKQGLQTGAPLVDKFRDNDCMFGGIQLAAKERMIEVGEETALQYLRGEELLLDSPYVDGYYWIMFNNMLLGPVKISRGRVVNRLPKSFYINKT